MNKYISEIKALPITYSNKTFYYGVPNSKEAMSIWVEGRIPLYRGNRGIISRSYFTSSLERSFDFAEVGYNRKTMKMWKDKNGRYGYLFIIKSKDLEDVFPNETSLGRFVRKVYEYQYKEEGDILDPEFFKFLTWVWSILSREDQQALMYNDADADYSVGRKVLETITDDQIIWLLNQEDIEVSNEGRVNFSMLVRLNRYEICGESSLSEDRNIVNSVMDIM